MRKEDNCVQSEPLAFSWLHTACTLTVGTEGAFLNDCDRTDMRQEKKKIKLSIQNRGRTRSDAKRQRHAYRQERK